MKRLAHCPNLGPADELRESRHCGGAGTVVKVLPKLWAHFEVVKDEEKNVCASRDGSALYNSEAATMRNRAKSFNIVQGSSSNVVAAFRAFSSNILEDTCNAVFPLELHTMKAKK